MKTKILIVMLLTAFYAWAAPKTVKKSVAKSTTKTALKVKTHHFEVKDSIRLFDREDPQGVGYGFNKSYTAEWPVTVNGKKSKALNKFLMEELFSASHNKSAFPNCPNDVKVLKGYVKKWVHYVLRKNTYAKEYIVKEAWQVPNITEL